MSAVTAANDQLFSSLGLSQAGQEQKDPSELGLNTFLKLMVTQLNNQNPFEPMENGDFLGQIAQFGTVSGLDQLNNAFEGLSGSLVSGQALQAGSLVGREVLAPLETGRLQAGGAIRGEVELPAGSGDLVVRVTDGVGQLVREIDLGGKPAGPVPFTWDGLTDGGDYAPPGLYQVRVQARRDGATEDLQTQLFSRVESVSIGAGGTALSLNLEGLGPIALDDVKQIH